MARILVHIEVLEDIKLCNKKRWYGSLGEEMLRICRLLTQDGILPGESPVHYIKDKNLYNKVFHAGINLPNENVGKKKGARIIYIKEPADLIKITYVGGHKDKRYNDSFAQVDLTKERYYSNAYLEYSESIFEKIE